MRGTRPTQVSNVPAGTSLFALIRTDIGIHEVRTQRQIVIRAGTSPGGLTTRRSEVAQRAADCPGVRIGLACRRSVPQLLWDCPEPPGSVKTRAYQFFLGVCGLSGTSRNLPEPRNGACYGRCTSSAPAPNGSALSPRLPSCAAPSPDLSFVCVDQPIPARQRWPPPSRPSALPDRDH